MPGTGQSMLPDFSPNGLSGHIYLCDLGNALFCNETVTPATPMQYRAPEVILGMDWSYAADQWSVGMMVSDVTCFVELRKSWANLTFPCRHGI
jgi:serine/threonine protein kinase